MSMNNNPVPMPNKKVTFKNINGTTYVYYTVRAYRNKDGKPTSDEVSIGKKDTITGQLIPNRRYFELFEGNKQKDMSKSSPIRVASYGTVYTLMQIVEKIGLKDILEKCFPEKWDRILSTAFYMLCCGNVMMYIEDWFDETDISFVERFGDHQCSRMFASITYDERMSFFKLWVKLIAEHEYIAYDVTSVSTYSNGIDIAEWGYNRDGEKLLQVNMGMFQGMESKFPVYYELYNGSIPDKSRLEFMMLVANKLGIKNVKFVLDRGFSTEDNLKYIHGEGNLFISAIPSGLVEAKRFIDDCKDNIRKSVNRLPDFDVYAVSIETEIYGFKMKAHIYLDLDKQSLDEKELYAHISRLQEDLSKLSKNGGVTKKYKDIFIIDKKNEEGFNFTPDNVKIDERLSRTGFYILISNDLSLDSNDVLRIYRGRDVIEKNFYLLKNPGDFNRLRTHLNETTDGKVFVGFIALILRTYLLNRIKSSPDIKTLTFEKVILELKKIKVITYEDSSRILMTLTKRQKSILDALGFSPDDLIQSAS